MSYNSTDPATRLTAVRISIDKALSAQSYSERGRSVSRANLDALFKLESQLQRQVEDAGINGGRMASVGQLTRSI